MPKYTDCSRKYTIMVEKMTPNEIYSFLKSWYTNHNYPHAADNVYSIMREHPEVEKLVRKLEKLGK